MLSTNSNVLKYSYMYVGTKSSEKVTDLITNGRFCNAVCKMSPSYQTSGLEAFHSVSIILHPNQLPFHMKECLQGW